MKAPGKQARAKNTPTNKAPVKKAISKKTVADTTKAASPRKKTSGKKQTRAPGMYYPATHGRGAKAVNATEEAVLEALDWIFRSQDVADQGIDAHIETVVPSDRLSTGRLVALQVKGGTSWFREKDADGQWVFRSDTDHLRYWLSHSLPVVVVIVDQDRNVYWQHLTEGTYRETDRGFVLPIPVTQILDAAARDALLAVAGKTDEALELKIKTRYEVLPGDVNHWLKLAWGQDPMRAARVAGHLADGRGNPRAAVAALVSAQPTWIVDSSAAYELWFAVAAFATAHELHDIAAQAFRHAADTDEDRAARPLAFAALTTYTTNLAAARRLIRQSKKAGGGLLTDSIEAVIAIPRDSADIVPIPPSALAATEDELDRESVVRNVIAEMSMRAGNIDEAVRQRQRAVQVSSTHGHQMPLLLAQTLLRRAQNDGGGNRADTRAAAESARTALTELRRFGGPSHEALEALQDIAMVAGDFDEAVRLALPDVDGGAATAEEAARLHVARRGAIAALGRGRSSDAEQLMRVVPDGPARREIAALTRLAAGELDRGEQILVWEALVTEADNDVMTARCCQHLVALGQWPPQIEDLTRRRIVPPIELEVLKAEHEYEAVDRTKGRARLVRLASKNPRAAFQLAQIVRRDEGTEAAIEVCRDQHARWNDPGLSLLLAEMLTASGDSSAAAEHMSRQLHNETLVVPLRQQMATWLLRRHARLKEWSDAERIGRYALELGSNDELVFELTALLEQLGRYDDARQLLSRHEPVPVKDSEIRLWMQLQLGESPSPHRLATMTRVARAATDAMLRSIIVSRLKLERDTRETPLPADVTEEIGRLLDETADDDLLSADQIEDAFRTKPRHVLFRTLLPDAQAGRAPWSDVADAIQHPYTATLIRRPADVLISQDLAEPYRKVGMHAAVRALHDGSCVLDLSGLYLLALLPNSVAATILDRVEFVLPSRSTRDLTLTADGMRSERLSGTILTADANGARRVALPLSQARYWRTVSDRMNSLASGSPKRLAGAEAGRISPAEEALLLASQESLTLWCDDNALRQRARGRNLEAFGLIDLLDAMVADGTSVDMAVVRRELAHHRIATLALDLVDLRALGSSVGWSSAVMHIALSRGTWWEAQDDEAALWFEIASAAREAGKDALTDATVAAIRGVVGAGAPSFATLKHQRWVVLALAACGVAGRTGPTRFLQAVARERPAEEAPRGEHVFRMLQQELSERGIADPDAVALRLIPVPEM